MRFFRIQLVALLVAAFGLIVGPLSSTATVSYTHLTLPTSDLV